jgi:chromosome segregation ATPase
MEQETRESIMSGMRRADRRDDSYDNSVNHPQSRRAEPTSSHELKQIVNNLRFDCGELRDKVKTEQKRAEDNQTLYQEAQQKHETAIALYEQEKTKSGELLIQFEEVQIQREQYFSLYQQAQTEREHYVTLYTQVQQERDNYVVLYERAIEDLKFERRSKAGIKGWETRRKRENERLKQEIAEMTIVIKESLERKEEAVESLYALANRMDRIQKLVDSVEDTSSSNPLTVIEKLKRAWQAVKEILAE